MPNIEYIAGARLRHIDGSEATVSETSTTDSYRVRVEADDGLEQLWPRDEIAGFGSLELRPSEEDRAIVSEREQDELLRDLQRTAAVELAALVDDRVLDVLRANGYDETADALGQSANLVATTRPSQAVFALSAEQRDLIGILIADEDDLPMIAREEGSAETWRAIREAFPIPAKYRAATTHTATVVILRRARPATPPFLALRDGGARRAQRHVRESPQERREGQDARMIARAGHGRTGRLCASVSGRESPLRETKGPHGTT